MGIIVAISEDETSDIKLTPSINEVEHFENESYVVACQALLGKTRLRWFDSEGKWVENDRGRIHVKEKDNEILLVFTSISLVLL